MLSLRESRSIWRWRYSISKRIASFCVSLAATSQVRLTVVTLVTWPDDVTVLAWVSLKKTKKIVTMYDVNIFNSNKNSFA